MNLTICPATRADYPAIVAIGRSATADYVQSVADLEYGDQTRPPGVIAGQLVAVLPDKQVVGNEPMIRVNLHWVLPCSRLCCG